MGVCVCMCMRASQFIQIHIPAFKCLFNFILFIYFLILIGGQLLYNIALALPYINMNLPQVCLNLAQSLILVSYQGLRYLDLCI